MTIGEVIEMLTKIFGYLAEIFNQMFGAKEEEGEVPEEAPVE